MTATIVMRDNGAGTFDVRLSVGVAPGSGSGSALFPGRSAAIKKRRASKAMTKQG